MSFWRGWPLPVALLLVRLAGAAPDDSSSHPKVFQPRGWLPPVDHCPESCDTIFTKLEAGNSVGGKTAQHIKIQERGGEPGLVDGGVGARCVRQDDEFFRRLETSQIINPR